MRISSRGRREAGRRHRHRYPAPGGPSRKGTTIPQSTLSCPSSPEGLAGAWTGKNQGGRPQMGKLGIIALVSLMAEGSRRRCLRTSSPSLRERVEGLSELRLETSFSEKLAK